MINSRRKEPFRYLFAVPEPCLFQIIELNGLELETRQALAELIDWNKSGCKLVAGLDLRSGDNLVRLTIDFPFAETFPLTVNGEVRWQSDNEGGYLYGIQFMADDDLKERVKVEIRRLAAENRINAV